MNLLTEKEKAVDGNYFTINSFRAAQYQLINYFMTLSIEYISKQNKNYLKLQNLTIQEEQTYNGIYHNELTRIIVDTTSSNGEEEPISKNFMKFFIPTLVDGCFFILNENCFVPTLYIMDKPIVIKKKSIKLSSTFNSITIYDKFVTFMGNNIPAAYFLDIFLSDNNVDHVNLKKEFIQNFQIIQTPITESDLLNYFANLFRCDADRAVIHQHFNNIFFDDYTKMLYQQCYNLEEKDMNIETLLKQIVYLQSTQSESAFIDLDQKRLVFIEVLLWPIFRRVAIVASQASRGFFTNTITMDQLELVKNFYTKLHNKFIYDNVNAYDTMLQHKAHMLSPNAERAPSIVANLHPSHFERICPTSVSSQNPGETIQIVAESKIDIFGRFL